MKRLFMISNRLPLQVADNDGVKKLIPIADGFDSGLKNFTNHLILNGLEEPELILTKLVKTKNRILTISSDQKIVSRYISTSN